MNRFLSLSLIRFRIDIKIKLLRKYKKKGHILNKIKYLLIDPEIDTFSYKQTNSGEISSVLSNFINCHPLEIKQYFEEAYILQKKFWRNCWKVTLLRSLYMKLFPKFGRNINEYVIVRAVKPKNVIELGIKYGLGSWLILEALKRNAIEGMPGILKTVDTDSNSGIFLTLSDCQYLEGNYLAEASNFLDKNEFSGVTYVISDTLANVDQIRKELEFSLKKRVPLMYFQLNASWTNAVFCEKDDYCYIEQKSNHPIYKGRDVFLGRFKHIN